MNDAPLIPDRPDGLTESVPRPLTESEAQRSIDDLVTEAHRYRSSKDYQELLQFVAGFRRYAPFNAMLLHVQRSGATFVESAHSWRERYGRRVRPGEQPLVALRPFGPVMFVYDVSQTEPEPGAAPLPSGITTPYAMPPVLGADAALASTIGWAKRDGVRTTQVPAGCLTAGCLRRADPGLSQSVQVARRPPQWREVPIAYEVEVNRDFSPTEAFATVAHELGHLYCGHLGTPNPQWWSSRTELPEPVAEFEAESVAFLACRRLDERAAMPPHLAQYLSQCPEVPAAFSLARVMSAAGRVIAMADGTVKPHRP